MAFSRQEYWIGLPFPSPRDLPDLGIKPISPALTGRLFTTELPGEPIIITLLILKKKKTTDGIFCRDHIAFIILPMESK